MHDLTTTIEVIMKAIYSCKLYVNSNNKDRIVAAIKDPINIELVKQLRSYLDEEYVSDEFLDVPDKVDNVPDPEYSADMDVEKDSESPASENFSEHRSVPKPENSSPDEGEPIPESKEEQSDEPADEEADVSESSKLSGSFILGSQNIGNALDITSLVGTLNLNSETSGVVRCTLKTDPKTGYEELWIYYSDETNLNNVMEAVINTLEACGYTMLSFNRLARSNNAIVFEILKDDLIVKH